MGENKSVLELKRRRLKEEVNSENPDKNKIKRLKESIKRHKEIAISLRYKRIKNKRRQKRG
ncbi:MAG TPA: hypothetical protein ENG87_02190 [Candidatus Pacearchaeota archaeon]|nr:hypothetical protein [Candidatus Pacearchaeota archaeon]